MPVNDVAVVAPYAGAVYEGGPIGGAELQTAVLARWLGASGLTVAHVVRLGSEPTTSPPAGVSVVPIDSRYLHGGIARRRALADALRRADARVYVQRSAGFETGIVGAFARAMRRKFVFSASSDANFFVDPARARLSNADYVYEWKSRLQYRVGLRAANLVVAQTRGQAELARRTFGIDAEVVPSFAEPADADDRVRRAFLWIGSIVGVKDPLSFVRLAQMQPESEFTMVATERRPAWHALGDDVRREAAEVSNLSLIDPLPRARLLELYAGSIAVVNTSLFEGFPNAFLEAWARATPALSLNVDPDGAISRRGLGVCANGSLDALAEAVTSYEHRPEVARSAGQAARSYLEEVHAPELVAARWTALVARLLGRSS